MLTINVLEHEFYDESTGMFFQTKPQVVKLEHSLISVSKWESIWQKPYLPSHFEPGMRGYKEELSYISCMIIGNVPDDIPKLLLAYHSKEIREYLGSPSTATTITRRGVQPSRTKRVTSELVYYWMIKFQIPFECEKWHFNRLLTLIDVCSTKALEESGKGKMSQAESVAYRQQLNKARLGLG